MCVHKTTMMMQPLLYVFTVGSKQLAWELEADEGLKALTSMGI